MMVQSKSISGYDEKLIGLQVEKECPNHQAANQLLIGQAVIWL